MRNLKQILLAILVLTFITACDKDENDPKETLEKATISAKWNVNNSSEYESFEFNESGNYIVLKNSTTKSTNDQIILFGTYEIIGNTTIVLSDFGTLTIADVNENSINFTIQLTSDPDNEIIINASKQTQMESTTNTELLCRTWELISINGEDVAGTEDELTVLFSAAGTYFVSYSDGESGLAQWKWKDELETEFLYSWEEEPNWEEEDFVEITELTNSTLKILEKFEDDEDELYVLAPIVNTKSAKINSSVDITEKISKTGLLKK
tara:strand:- start:130 stop:927 length:798 start_codon:yes stop_codon:yes gene_type:complete